MASKTDKREEETRCWAWTSLILGAVILLGAIGSAAYPVVILQLASVIGSLLFLFGGEELQQTSVVLLGVAAVFECVGGALALLVGFFFIATPSGLSGWSLVLGLYALIFSVPVISVGLIDAYTVYRVRNSVFGDAESTAPLNVTPAVNLAIPATV